VIGAGTAAIGVLAGYVVIRMIGVPVWISSSAAA
jgi:hypothetical protein